MRPAPVRARALALLVGLTLFGVAGCGPSVGTLTGKVTYKGNALKGGNVTLIPADSGETFSAAIQEDGTYTFEQLKSGKYKVCVDTSGLKPQRTTGGRPAAAMKNEPPKGAEMPEGYKMAAPFAQVQAENARRYVEIPAQYADPNSTSLSLDYRGGSQKHDITLD